MAMQDSDRGRFYEDKGTEFLRLKGYNILKRNFRSAFGEIDIIAESSGCLVFVEVKGRKAETWVYPRESVDRRKQDKLLKTALFYISGRKDLSLRFDVLEISKGRGWLQYILIENAFELNENLQNNF